MSRHDIVVYGATGFTGGYIVRALATNPLFEGKTVAVAGRSEAKLRKALEEAATDTGVAAIKSHAIIVADTSDESSLANMAKQAVVVINAVGPYRLHGEPVVRAAVENGASHIDISGEPAFIEQMELKYGELAKEKGVYVVSACGWDSIPCDLGVDFLKRNFPGTLGFVESFAQNHIGPSGYSFNTGTYQTLILGIANARQDNHGKVRRQIMPNKPPETHHKPPTRGPIWHVQEHGLNAWALPFPGSDKSIVQRSQYHDYHDNGKRPVLLNTYFAIGSLFYGVLVALWMVVFSIMCMFGPTRRLLQNYPDQCTFYMFKNSGPTKQQMKEMSFSYYFFGRGWGEGETADEATRPTKSVGAVCRGPDPGYIATSGCIVSSALALLNDRDQLPKDGGVYTTASAFRHTRIYEYLKSFGITFDLIQDGKL